MPLSLKVSRRHFLGTGLGAVLGSAAVTPRRAMGAAPPTAASAPPPTENITKPERVLFLVNHITQGYSRAAYDEALALGYKRYLETQLAWEVIDDSALDALLAGFPTLGMTARQLYDTYVVPGQQSVVPDELRRAAVLRSVLSLRQLYERMVEFWTDHFNIDVAKNQCAILKTVDDREVIRKHALGRFSDLLSASAHSAAMLFYLDNNRNFSTAPNENYARELMELHTLGAGNFTEADVKEVARCFTGWGLYSEQSPSYGEFFFNASLHDDGAKTVLGVPIPAGGGESDGQTVLSLLAGHPVTAHRIAAKLCRWLLVYEPPYNVVDSVAATFLATGGDIKAMIRVILDRDAVLAADPWQNPKLRRPFHFLCSLLRACQAVISPTNGLVSELARLGQPPFGWPLPNGYPDSLDTWGTSVLPRWITASRLLSNQIAGVSVDVTGLFGDVPRSEFGATVNAILTGGALASADQVDVQAYVDSLPNAPTLDIQQEALALAASSPSYQFY